MARPCSALCPSAPYRKTYGFDPAAFADCGPGTGRLLLTARQAGALCGYLLAAHAWNGYALIEDFAVARPARRSGIGRALMDQAVRWAEAEGLPGLRLETQSSNVPACRFYEACGFRLGGFDRHLYDALGGERRETALYWYRFLAALNPGSGGR